MLFCMSDPSIFFILHEHSPGRSWCGLGCAAFCWCENVPLTPLCLVCITKPWAARKCGEGWADVITELVKFSSNYPQGRCFLALGLFFLVLSAEMQGVPRCCVCFCSCMGGAVRGLQPSLELWHRGLAPFPEPVAIFLREMAIYFFFFLLFAGLSGSASCPLLSLGTGCVQRGQQWQVSSVPNIPLGFSSSAQQGGAASPAALPGALGEAVVKVLLVVCISLMMVLDDGFH